MAEGSLARSHPQWAETDVVRLDVYRALRALKSTARAVAIPAPHPGGFETTIHAGAGIFSLSLGGLVQDFDTLDEATTWAGRAQLPDRRLRIDYAGRHAVQWTLERVSADGAIETELASGRPFLIASLLHRRTEYRSNAPGRAGQGSARAD